MQQSIIYAQTSAAVADDEDLTRTLVDILVVKSGADPRSFKGVVLNEALHVAGKLTADQVNLLTALVMLSRTIIHSADTVDSVLITLDSRCRPLYRKIPTSNNALQYMSYTGVGDIERLSAGTMATNIINTYDSVFTNGFSEDELPEGLKTVSANLPRVDERVVVDAARLRFPVASAQSLDRLADGGVLNQPYLTHVEAMKSIIVNRHSPVDKFMEVVESDKPDLAKFLRDLDKIGASTFMLSSVGVALGQANWRRLQPETAPDVDIYLR
jgi:hypothetical protein